MENTMESIWKPVPGGLLTKWAENMDVQNVLPEYPRPQMVRDQWLNLNGLWDYTVRTIDEPDFPAYTGKILVPFPLESALSGVKRGLLPDEVLWYRRVFTVPSDWHEKRLLLHFGAVDWRTNVWINGHHVGEHTGGYYPFTFDISKYIREGTNEITVSVWDGTDACSLERGKQALEPQGIFYTAVSGIWQTVWMEPVPKTYLKSHRLTPDLDNERVLVSIECGGELLGSGLKFEVTIFDGNEEVTNQRTAVNEVLALEMQNAKLWSPDSPFLYDIRVSLLDDETVIDSIDSYFGMRKYSIDRDSEGVKRLFVNNQPLFQNGVLDQGYWPDGLYTAPTDEALELDVALTKQLGFNMSRKHVKVEPARWYYHCDRLGLIVWQDMVSGGKNVNIVLNGILPMVASGVRIRDDKYEKVGRKEKLSRDTFEKELREMIDSLYNFPCIGMWVPFNEAWGQFDAERIAQWVKEYDATRWVDHASGWHDQGAGDLKSVHTYFRKLKKPKKIKDRPWAITEFGGYSLPIKGHVWEETKEFGYKKFKRLEEFEEAYRSLMQKQVQPLIAKGLSATVYTQLTDIESETNGLITYDRKVLKLGAIFHVVVEQTKDYEQRMKYHPEQDVFLETEYKSLLFARNFPYPYGWLKESGTPPGDHLDCILMSSNSYELGSIEAVKIIGCFRRSDGDHKLVCVPEGSPEMDLADLHQEKKEALYRLYPYVGEGEGWFGAEKAREIVETFLSVGRNPCA